jgi:hypothetical protein
MNLFDQLDSIIEAAINETMGDERARQKKQATMVDKLDLRAGDNKSIDEVEEADEDDQEEEAKLKGDSHKSKKTAPKEAGEEESGETPGTPTSKKMKDPTAKQLKNPDFKAIANNINLLRGGKSVKDPGVRKNLKDYLDKLSREKRQQVLVYLNSLAQVMAGVKSGSAALDPTQAEKEAKPATKKKKEPKANSSKSPDVIIVGA